jgi:hypothetical protein
VIGPAAVAAVLPVLVTGGLARQVQRLQADRRELDAYLRWLLADIAATPDR